MDGWIAEWAARQETQASLQASSRRALLVRSPAVANLEHMIAADQVQSTERQPMETEDEHDSEDSDPSFQAPVRAARDLEAAQHLTLLKLDGLTPRGPSREDRRHKRDIVREAAAAETEFRRNLGMQRRLRLAGRLETSMSEPRRHGGVNAVLKQFLIAQPAVVLRRND